MRRRLFYILLLGMISLSSLRAQEFALDFTRTDCDGRDYHLFADLDEGKVIILDFIMVGCAPCLWATRDLDTIAGEYEATHPGRVEIYSFSYDDAVTCEQMIEWQTIGEFADVILFTGGAEQVAYYGGMGMPTVVVVGTAEHRVFYNGYGYSSADDSLIIAAIDTALAYIPTGLPEAGPQTAPAVYPTLFSGTLNVDINEESIGSRLILSDVSGREVLVFPVTGAGIKTLPVDHLPAGMYFAVLRGKGDPTVPVKLIKY